MEPIWLIVLRVAERIVIYGCAIFTIYLGYSLYRRGISKGRGDLQAKTGLGQIILSGTGPGLFFMAFGAIILLVGLFTGGGKVKVQDPNIGKKEPLHNFVDTEVEMNRWELEKELDDLSEQADEPNNTAP